MLQFVEMFFTAKKVCLKPIVYRSWDIRVRKGVAAREKEGVPYNMLELVQSERSTL